MYMDVTVYTQPRCKKCDILKKWLKSKKIKFEEKMFDTEAQTKMIMNNMFGDPPFVEIDGEIMSSSEMFEMDGMVPSVSESLVSFVGVEK